MYVCQYSTIETWACTFCVSGFGLLTGMLISATIAFMSPCPGFSHSLAFLILARWRFLACSFVLFSSFHFPRRTTTTVSKTIFGSFGPGFDCRLSAHFPRHNVLNDGSLHQSLRTTRMTRLGSDLILHSEAIEKTVHA